MPEIDPVILQLRADVASYNATMQQTARRVDASLKLQEGSIVRLENRMTTGFERVGGAATRAQMLVGASMNAIKGALAGVSAVALARSFLSISDEAKKLDAQLRLATQGFGSFGQAQEDVRRIADETRSGLSDTSGLYGNFLRVTKEMGASQTDAARATETLTKSYKISGASAVETAQSTRQLVQGLQSGTLRGDEFNSVMESSPRFARLLAESLGVPIGRLRAMAEEGELTSGRLLRAMTDKKFTAGIDSEFREIPITFDDAMTKVYNAAVVTFGAFDRGGEFSTALANFVSDGSDGFADLETRAEQFGIEVRSTLAGLGDVFDPLLEAGASAFDALGLKAFDLQGFIRQTLREFDGIANYLADTPGGRLVGAKGSNALGRYDAGKKADQGRRQGEAAERRFRSMTGGHDVMGNPLPGTPSAGRGPAPKPVASSGGKKKAAAAPKSKLNPEAFAREEASLNDQILRLKAVELTNADEKAKVELSRIEAAKSAAVKEVASDERYTAEQRAKVIALTETVAALEAAKVIHERDVQATRDALDIKLSGLRNDEDLLRAQADLTTNRRDRRDIELRLLDLAYEQERAELEAIKASETATDAQKKIAQARLDVLGQLQTAGKETVNRDNESPLARYSRELNDTDIRDKVEEYAVDELRHVQDGIRDALTKKLGIKDPFLAGLLDLFIQQVIMKPIANAFSGASGSGGGGFFGSLLSGLTGFIGGGGGGGFFGGVTSQTIGFPGGGIGGGMKIPGFAKGTKSAPGGLAWVGEDGPELVDLPRGSRVIPNNELAARSMVGATATSAVRQTIVQQSFTLDNRHGITTPELLEDVNRIARQEAARAGSASYQQAMKDAPKAVSRAQRFRTK